MLSLSFSIDCILASTFSYFMLAAGGHVIPDQDLYHGKSGRA
jgi:hypothetical protein